MTAAPFLTLPVKRKLGFSLVELSIVLVILGLLVGGVLSGQSLIRAAELRAVSSEYSRYVTAVQSFRDKYFALPGDMNNATAFWGYTGGAGCTNSSGTAATTPGTCDGDANGVIAFAASASQSGEFTQLWRQLSLAGLIEGTYSGLAGSGGVQHCVIGTACPRSRLNNAGWGVWGAGDYIGNAAFYAINYGNAFTAGASSSTNIPVTSVFKPEEAWNIDTKFDDGRPTYGKVIGGNWSTCAVVNSGVASATNLDTSYNLASTSLGCSLVFSQAM